MGVPEYLPVRYPPDEGTTAGLCLDAAAETFCNDIDATIINESFGGCGLAIAATERLQKGDVCLAKVGELEAMKAVVVWRVSDQSGGLHIGLEYRE
jgi:hypothetical protein